MKETNETLFCQIFDASEIVQVYKMKKEGAGNEMFKIQGDAVIGGTLQFSNSRNLKRECVQTMEGKQRTNETSI